MPKVTLPDGTEKKIASGSTLLNVAQDISNSLAKNAIAGIIDDEPKDLCVEIDKDCRIEIVKSTDKLGIEVVRHSFAHLIGHAIKQIYPEAKMAIGPVIKDGFYYDIDLEESISEDNLVAIENKIRELIKTNYDVVRKVVTAKEALKVFKGRNEPYKEEIVKNIPKGETIALYYHEEYIDMCRGPHVPNTKHLRHFKLTKVSGAYWRGDSKNEMLQRIYGTAWNTKEELDDYTTKIEEAEKRDHRKIGKKLDLFHFQDEAPGMVFWHNKGWSIYTSLQDYIRKVNKDNKYHEINTPQIISRKLWELSGHWEKFGDMIFTTNSDKKDYAIKPMSCPGHIQVFNQGLKSYRDLPVKLSEFGLVHRNEPSGTLHGLMRARQFVQDDAHIFCTKEQLENEIKKLIELTIHIYKDFGFENIDVVFSTRPENKVGDDKLWDKSEKILKEVLDKTIKNYQTHPGEGAFYGPKIEFILTDSLDRIWQCGTIQLDFSMPTLLGATYVAENGSKIAPVMIHRAILGSLERFIGILIEHHAGVLPFWLAPTQVVIATITDKHAEYAKELDKRLMMDNYRSEVDLRNEKIGYKIREHVVLKVPYVVIIGDKEASSQTLSIRTYTGDEINSINYKEFIQILGKNNLNKN